ncbi:MAG: S1 RNA-binding domain-containing protein, partial [Alphaproteobacteria bacterium]|nr:S1 RNA-binding domain-containing protein [Alphaproteobacteria bacterium]
MTKRMLIDDTQPEETRVVIVDGNKVEDVEFESTSRKQIKGNIYTAKVIRIEPSLQAAFIDYGGNKHGFLAFNEIHPDYYTVADSVMQEVEAEVDEIIENKIKYLKEREAAKARYKAEKEAEENQRRMEAEQAHEMEESQLEPAQNVIPENDDYLQNQTTGAENVDDEVETQQQVDVSENTENSENDLTATEETQEQTTDDENVAVSDEEKDAKLHKRRHYTRRPRDRKKS